MNSVVFCNTLSVRPQEKKRISLLASAKFYVGVWSGEIKICWERRMLWSDKAFLEATVLNLGVNFRNRKGDIAHRPPENRGKHLRKS